MTGGGRLETGKKAKATGEIDPRRKPERADQRPDSRPAARTGTARAESMVGKDVELYKFQRLQVYQLALDYVDRVYALTQVFPDGERYNLRSQLERAATSVVLNIAEGSTGQSDAEQNRFLGVALRSYIETIACLDLIERRGFLTPEQIASLRKAGHQIFVRLQALRRAMGKC